MGKQATTLAAGWVLDAATKLYHYYKEDAGHAAHPPLCEGPVLLTRVLHQRAGELPEGLKPRYLNKSPNAVQAGICKACANRHANLKK